MSASVDETTRRSGFQWRYLLVVPILALFLSVLVGGHWLLVQRLILDPALPAGVTRGLLVLVGLLFATLVLQPIGERTWPRRFTRLVAWPAAIWMGTAWLLLVALGISGAIGLLLGAAFPPETTESVAAARVRAFAVVGLTLPAVVAALRQGLSRPAVKRVEVTLPRWPAALDGFRIAQISDIHIGSLLGRDFAAWLVDRVNGLSPDLVAVTGDLVDGSVKHLAEEAAPFAGLRGRLGVYFVTGNHDHYSNAESWSDAVADMGMRVLRNEHLVMGEDEARFVLAGVDDHRSGQFPGDSGGEDLDAALAGLEADLPVILLAHDPSTFKKAHARGIDLQLSGHTHGGQIWPFRYLVRAAIPFVAGLHHLGSAALYVSRGTGFWGPPMRLGAPAEITDLVIRSGRAGEAQSA